MSGKTHYHFNPVEHQDTLVPLLVTLEKLYDQKQQLQEKQVTKLLKTFPKNNTGYFAKSDLIAGYKYYAGTKGLKPYDATFVSQLKMKPIRTSSGVTPVTVLTKPFPCPGKCIFCPNDVRMPKSYLADEPGAQRAERNHFDPYLQTYNRLAAFSNIGHQLDKAELIILGGTWSFYPEAYKIWYIKRCFEALNDFGEGLDQRKLVKPSIDVSGVDRESKHVHFDPNNKQTYNLAVSKLYVDQELKKRKEQRETASWTELEYEQLRNETAQIRCVGLVLETRPDYISETEVIMLRRLGCTKTQIGLQSLQDNVLEINNRGHDVAASRKAMKLLRQAGFKIHAHWMPNLYGSGVEADIEDYQKLFNDLDFKPDELKIYPCSLIDNTELMEVHKQGKWQPYLYEELLEVLTHCLQLTPSYCRLTRVVRDIPGTDIVTGNKLTNFRQIAEAEAIKRGWQLQDIRSREIKDQAVKKSDLRLDEITYHTSVSTEIFLQYIVIEPKEQDLHPAPQVLSKNQRESNSAKIAGFLRLSLPTTEPFIDELKDSAIIREVHVYGSVVNVGQKKQGAAQHLGLGKSLITRAEAIAQSKGYRQISVISAIGTREYYRKLGFTDKPLYQHKLL